MRAYQLIKILILMFIPMSAQASEEFLSPEQAFQFNYTEQDNAVSLHWGIADGYYLYKKRITVKLDNNNVIIDNFPEGEEKHDEYFGDVIVYHHELDLVVPSSDKSVMQISYQGCAEAGLCYPPKKITLNLNSNSKPLRVSDSTRLLGMLQGDSIIYTLMLFFGIGAVTAFAGCSYPMFPILSKIIVGQGKKITRGRSFSLSLAYVLPIAIVYALIGIVAGKFGGNLSAWFQTPIALGFVSLTLAVMALSMLGLFELQMPSAIQSRLSSISGEQTGGSFVSAATMGFISAFIVSACVVPPIVAAITYITQTGDTFLGASAMFCFGLGLGSPLLLLGLSAGWLLPKAGNWMDTVQKIMGIFLMSAAIWIFDRVVPNWITMLLWASLAAFIGAYLLSGKATNKVSASIGILFCCVALGTAAYTLNTKLTKPEGLAYEDIQGPQALKEAIESNQGKAILIDYYADWCVACQHMEHKVFNQPEIQAQLEQFQRLKIDLTENTAGKQAIMKQQNIFGPPSLLFLSPSGNELRELRITGEVAAEELSPVLSRALQQSKAL